MDENWEGRKSLAMIVLAVLAVFLFAIVLKWHRGPHVMGAATGASLPVLVGGLDDGGARHVWNTDQAGNLNVNILTGVTGAIGASTFVMPDLVGGLDDGGARHIFNTDPNGNLIVSLLGGAAGVSGLDGGTPPAGRLEIGSVIFAGTTTAATNFQVPFTKLPFCICVGATAAITVAPSSCVPTINGVTPTFQAVATGTVDYFCYGS